jgi:hypothetical protein
LPVAELPFRRYQSRSQGPRHIPLDWRTQISGRISASTLRVVAAINEAVQRQALESPSATT